MESRDVSKRIAELSPEKRALLRRRLQEQQPSAGRPPPTLPALVPDPEQRFEPFPLTDVQQAYWAGRSGFVDLGATGTNFYQEFELSWEHIRWYDRANQAVQHVLKRLTRRGFLNLDVFKTNVLLRYLDQAMQRVIARHDMLRAVILPDGQQRILPEAPPARIKVVDLRSSDPDSVERELERTRVRMRTTKAPIDQWPLFEVLVHRLDGERLRVHLRIDTLLLDGISRSMLILEWFQQIGNPNLQPPACSYRDYAVTWAAFKDSELYTRAKEYWMRRLPSLPPAPDLPLARHPSPEMPSFFVDRAVTLLEPELWQRFKARAARADLTPSGAVAAAFVEVLTTWSANPDMTLGLEGTYRPPIHPQIGDVLGNFNTIFLLAVEPAPGPFEARARNLQRQLLEDLEQRYFPGFQVLRELNRQHGAGRHAAMPVIFNSVIEYSHPSYSQGADDQNSAKMLLSYRQIEEGLHIPQVLLFPTHSESPDGALLCTWKAAEALFPDGMSQDMLDAYMRILERLAADEDAWQATSFPLVPQAQLEQRAAINATQAPLPAGLLHTAFLAQAYLRPQQTAIVAQGERLTYAALALRTIRLSHQLCDLGARPNTLVAVVMQPGWEQVVAVLGTLQAGAAYLPLDPSLPPEQFQALIEQGGVTLALTQSSLEADLAWPQRVKRVCVDALTWTDAQDYPVPLAQNQENLAYVIYTAGTTGPPKGVMIDHRAALNTIAAINARFAVGPADRLLALAPLHADLAVYDLFGTLAAGGTIVYPDATATRDPAAWAELIAQEAISVWNGTPAMLDRLVTYLAGQPERRLPSLRLALLSRDWLPLGLAARLTALAPNAEVVSLGGSTETAIWATIQPIGPSAPPEGRLPYGRPLSNQRAYVLNAALEPCPAWVSGQLYLSGVGLASGYWRDLARTRASFITHPRSGERLFATGDRARYLPDGSLELLGPAEECAVTIAGYPVDLRQIAAALEQHPALRAAVVQPYTDAAGVQRLVAYVAPKIEDGGWKIEDRQPGASEAPSSILHPPSSILQDLRAFLKEKLPDYMVPTTFLQIDTLPLTPTGKVDRRALPLPEPRGGLQPAFVAPRDTLEIQMARLWEDFFGTRPIGVTQSFFDLGGDSFAAVRLLTQIQALFGHDVPLASFLLEPTVAHLSQIVREATLEQLAQKIDQTTSVLRPEGHQPADSQKGRTMESDVSTAQPPTAQGMRTFFLIWFGQLISQIGTGLTGFGLSIWVFQRTGSATDLALIGILGVLPIIIFSPLAGALVDRWDRRRTMILSDTVPALGTVAFIVLLLTGQLQLWHIYLLVTVASIFRTFQFLAHGATTSLLVPKEQLGRANGMVQLGQGIGQLVAPVLAGVLVGLIGLAGVIAIDLATFLVALGTLIVARIPRPVSSAERQQQSLMRDTFFGFIYLWERPALLGLLIFFAINNFMLNAVVILATPLLLSFTTPAALGTVLSVAGLGILGGSIAMSAWGGPRRRIYGVFGGLALSGLAMIVAGLAPSALLVGVAAFFFTFGTPISNGSNQTIWQSKVAPDVQGRVFGIRSLIDTSMLPLAFITSGLLADHLFNPLLVAGGPLAGSVGQIIGVGPGRGIGLLFIVMGFLSLLVAVGGALIPRLRRVEQALPDAVVEAAPAAPEVVEPSLNGHRPQPVTR